MAEIKQNFSAGKMNKDLDERLLPKGEYRHAENIQLSTSEGSDVGALENILSNTKLSDIGLSDAVCVGVYANEKENDLYWFVASENKDMILKYSNSGVTPVLVDINKNVLKFNSNSIITGINIIDNLLLWTDNNSEPKKINVDFCIEGTIDQNTHTKLIVPERDIDLDYNDGAGVDIREEHITVIKKAPKTKLEIEVEVDVDTTAYLENVLMRQTYRPSPLPDLELRGNRIVGEQFVLHSHGDNYNHFSNFVGGDNFFVGDELVFLRKIEGETELSFLPENFEIKAKIISDLTSTQKLFPNPDGYSGTPGLLNVYAGYTFLIEITEIAGGFSDYDHGEWFVSKKQNTIDFFEKQFARFSYRYKYRDGEYSTFAPFSEIAFKPSGFDYETKKAYNLGMENKLKNLRLRNFTRTSAFQNILEDIVQIDLLYKESNSPNIYLVEKLKYNDFKSISYNVEAPLAGPQNNWEANYYDITSDTIYSVLPSNQLLRPYDNVPKKALAQEVTGNRVVYGNYTQNYNLNEKPIIEAFFTQLPLAPSPNNPKKSLKSSRNYQLGIVYLDEYGRQTPVFSNSKSSFKIPIEESKNSNAIQFTAVTSAPDWASFYKIYVKETSNEYYNLAMDRVYKAKDGNIWLSFPSSERNKIDDETFLILKKEFDGNNQVDENLKYKVIAIENEAPIEVKSDNTFIADSNGTGGDITLLFTNDVPVIGGKSFQISEEAWKADGGPSIDTITETISFLFKDTSENISSDFYEVASVEYRAPYYNIKLVEKIKDKDKWIYTDYAGATTYNNAALNVNLSLRLYKDIRKEQPEFDGKFFVKILNDSLIDKYILKNDLSANDFVSKSYLDVFYLSDTTADYTNSIIQLADLYSDQGTIENEITPGSTKTDTRSDWVKVLKFDGGNTGSITSGWFIDQAYYKAKHPESNNLYDSVDTVTSADTNYTSTTTELYYDSTPKPEYDEGHGKGIYKDPITGQWYIELSFSQILPNAENKSQNHSVNLSGNYQYKADFTLNTDSLEKQQLFAVGSVINQEHVSEADIVGNLTKNNIFRFVGDTKKAKYIINDDVVIEKRYNYSGFAQVLNNYDKPFKKYLYGVSNYIANSIVTGSDAFSNTSGDGIEDVWDKFSESINRRITYIIPFALYDNNPILDFNRNPIYEEAEPLQNSEFISGTNVYTNILNKDYGADANTPTGFQFLEREENEHDSLVSSNPAIWETEPKENVDLDIYYEASNCLDISSHGQTLSLDWFNCYSFGNGVESNRLRDDFNQVTIDKGAIASSTIDFDYKEENRKNGLIYSGIYNSTSGVNNLNQFIQAEKITKDINPTYGSIQKLFSRNTDLITFCEDKVIKVLANKDALFNADGNPQLTASQNVLGQTMPFSGDYGISKNPESFAKDNYRVYFTDKNKGKVLRLSRDGITPISDYGMSDYFKKELKNQEKLIGSYDQKKNEYNLSLNFITVSYDEKVNGWSSFKSYVPEQGASVTNFYYTFKNGNLYKHHDDYVLGTGNITWNQFYGQQYSSKITTILNDAPDVIKSFKTINYEGSQSNVTANLNDANYYNLYSKSGWKLENIKTDKDSGFVNEFIEKEGKWFNNIKGREVTAKQEIDTSSFSFQGVGKASSIEFLDMPSPVEIFVEVYTIPTLDHWFVANKSSQQLFKRTEFSASNESSANVLNPNLVSEQIFGGNIYRHGEPVDEVLQFKIKPGIDISAPSIPRPGGGYEPRPVVPISASEFTLRHLDPPGADGERSRAFDKDGERIGAIATHNGAGGAVEDLGEEESIRRNEANPNTTVPGTGFIGSTFSPISANVSFTDTGVPNTAENHVLLNVPIKFITPSNVSRMRTIKIELFLEQNSNNI